MKQIICLMMLSLLSAAAYAQADRPNILIVWGDDIGWYNVSAYNNGRKCMHMYLETTYKCYC